MTEEYVNFAVDDLEIEGLLHLPERKPPFPAVIVCHPHPQYGGDMHNNVVLTVCNALESISVAALRFNFRGVGQSQGRYSKGIGEQEDVKGALAFLNGISSIDPERISLAGYSFGTMVALPVALTSQQVKAIALISPVITPENWQQLTCYVKPKLVLSGSNDFLVSSRDMKQMVEQLTDLDLCQVIPGADHFWWGYEEEISRNVSVFYSRLFRL